MWQNYRWLPAAKRRGLSAADKCIWNKSTVRGQNIPQFFTAAPTHHVHIKQTGWFGNHWQWFHNESTFLKQSSMWSYVYKKKKSHDFRDACWETAWLHFQTGGFLHWAATIMVREQTEVSGGSRACSDAAWPQRSQHSLGPRYCQHICPILFVFDSKCRGNALGSTDLLVVNTAQLLDHSNL